MGVRARILSPTAKLLDTDEGANAVMKFARHLETEWNPSYVDDAMDAHAQSINLPAASAVVFLDFPTVPRLAELLGASRKLSGGEGWDDDVSLLVADF